MNAAHILMLALAVDSTQEPSRDSSRNAGSTHAARDTVVLLPEVRVERSRVLSLARRRVPTGFVTEIRLGTTGRAFETLSEALGAAAGLHVQQYGGLGAFSTMSLRGAPPGQVAVLLDGSPLSSAAHGIVSLADLPATAVERVEIYRGVSPLEFPVVGPAGAINIVTLDGGAPRELKLTRGSFGTWEGRLSGSAALGALAALLHVGYQGSQGDFGYLDDRGTPFNPDDDRAARRVNNRFDASTAVASLSFRPRSQMRVALREDLFHKIQGVPGLSAAAARHTRLEFLRSLTQLDATVSSPSGRTRLKASTGLSRERSRFSDPEAELGIGRHDSDDRLGAEHAGLTLAWRDLPLGGALELTGLLRDERAQLADPADGVADPPGSHRATRAAGAAFEIAPLSGRLLLRAAQRVDQIRDRLRSRDALGSLAATDRSRQLVAPQLGLRLMAGSGVELRGNWSKAERAPEFLELFGDQGSVLGNPALLPEHSESWDAGGAWSGTAGPTSGAVEWAHFESRARDLVLYVRNSPSTVKAQNVSRAQIRGEELSFRLARSALTVAGSLTWESAIDVGPVPYWTGKRLPQRPGREGYLRIGWGWRRTEVGGDVHLMSDDYLDRYNSYRAGGRTLVGVWLALDPFARPLRLMIEGKNLGDERAADVAGFPLPGRSLFVSCEARLTHRKGDGK